MERGIIIELQPKSDAFDFSQMAVDIANGRPVDLTGCEVRQHVSIVDSFRPEFVQYIVTHGLTSLIRRESLTEALVARGTASSGVQSLLQAFLIGLSVTTDLVIVDPYFLAPTTDSSYPQLVEQILQPVLPALHTLTVVTFPNKIDSTILASLKTLLNTSAPHLTFANKTSNVFHDRFWLDPVSGKGFLTGSSLNGLGKKYALVDNLQPSDVSDILAVLKNENLI